MGILSSIKNRYCKAKNPIKYWRKKGVSIGDGCEIYSSASFGSEPYLVSLGNHVRINANVLFVTHDGGVWVLRELFEIYKDVDIFGEIVVGDNVHIGNNSIIMPGVKIGNNCIIGCGAIVTKDVPDNSIAVGVPARIIETVDQYAEKHKDDFVHTKYLTSEKKREVLLKKMKSKS